ncbi:hypothetical protein ACIHFE_34250 [Streptomyces sp. NPDC052396]|uniref:hypothetical protein n=1 Tax=Streptomyces sp. NPDC052396 TaxID=3365689 RepID=UPI0037D2BC10
MDTASPGSNDPWSASAAFATRIVASVSHMTGAGDEQTQRFRTWQIDARTGRALTEVLIQLGIHAAILDLGKSDTGCTGPMDGLRLKAVAESLRTRPRHELFASLPPDDEYQMHRVDELRLMSYTATSRSSLSLERLVQEAATMMLTAADRLPGPHPVLADLLPEDE